MGTSVLRMPGGSWSNAYDWLACETDTGCEWHWAARPSDRRVRRPASDASTMAAVAHIDLDMADTGGVARPEGFTFIVRKNGDVVIRHHGQVATTLRRARAAPCPARRAAWSSAR